MPSIQLPLEIWKIILKQKHQTAWDERKKKIHYKITSIIPFKVHHREFEFQDFFVSYHRTEHLEICVSERRGRTSLSYVLNVYSQEADMINIHRMKFVYCPVFHLI
jgi:DNA/RNA endonuclease G (NUC1)